MAQVTDVTLKSYFQAGDQPTESQFADFIDSKVNIADLQSPLSAFGTRVKATPYNAEGNGIVDDTEAFVQINADLAALTYGGTIFVDPGVYWLRDNLPFAANVMVYLAQGAQFKLQSGITVTFNGGLSAPVSQIFQGTGVVAFGKGMTAVYPEWWGAGAGVSDNTPAFQAMFNALPASFGSKIVFSPAAAYVIDDIVTITAKNNLHLRGEGWAVIKLSTNAHWGTLNHQYGLRFINCNNLEIDGLVFDGNGTNLQGVAPGNHQLLTVESSYTNLADRTVQSVNIHVHDNVFQNYASACFAARLVNNIHFEKNKVMQGFQNGAASADAVRIVRCNDVWVEGNRFDGGSNSDATHGNAASLLVIHPGYESGAPGSPPDIYRPALNHCAVLNYLMVKQFTVNASVDAVTDSVIPYSTVTGDAAIGADPTTNDFYFLCYDIGSGASAGFVSGDQVKVVSVDKTAKTFTVRRMDGTDNAAAAVNWGGQKFYWMSLKTANFCQGVHVQNNSFKNCGGGGVFLLGCKDWSISGNKALGNILDISLDAEWCMDGEMNDNQIFNPLHTGMAVIFFQRNVVVANNIVNVGATTVASLLQYSGDEIAADIVIQGNVIHGGMQLGPQSGQAWNSVVDGMQVLGNTLHGAPHPTLGQGSVGSNGLTIGTQTSGGGFDYAGMLRDILVQGNRIRGYSQRGMLVNACDGLTILDNLISNIGFDAILDNNTVLRQNTRVFVDRNILSNVGYRSLGGMALYTSLVASVDTPRLGPNNVWRNFDSALDVLADTPWTRENSSNVLAISPYSARATWDPASVADGAMTSTTITVNGAAIGDMAIAGFSTVVPAGMILAASVTAANTVTVTLFNKSGGTLDLASGILRVHVFKS